MTLGIITIAIGARKYTDQARLLAKSLRRNMPEIPLAVVSDDTSLGEFFDSVIPVDTSMPIATAQKLLVDRYSPFERTLFLDSDCIVCRPFHQELEAITTFDFSPILERMVGPDGTDEYVRDLRLALDLVGGTGFPKFNGGLYYFNRSDVAAQVFGKAREYFHDFRRLGIKPFDGGGPGDETVFALAMAHLGLRDLFVDGGRLMRTPTGLIGKIKLDPLGGGCTFRRKEGVVTPAICHFAGPFIFAPQYRLAELSLDAEKPISSLSRTQHLAAHLQSRRRLTTRFIRYKIDGLRKRMNFLRGLIKEV